MSVKVEKTENKNELKLEFTVEAKVFDEGIKKVFNKNAKYFNIPGFRKGRAPMNIVEKYYGDEIFYEDAFNEVVPAIYDEAIKNEKLEVVSRPKIDIVQMEKGKDLIFTAIVDVKPEVKLGKYKGISIEKTEYKVEETDIDAEIKTMAERNSRMVTVSDRAAKKGDIAVIDFIGSVNGVEFEGGKASNHELELGSNTFIPGFEDQVIGMKTEEVKDVKVKFPEEYFSKELAGKDAVFKVTLHEIKEKELPKIDDEFAKDVSEFDTLKELKADIKSKKEKQNEERSKAELEEKAVKAVAADSTIDIPSGMIELEIDNMEQDMDRRLSYQGINLEQYLQMLGKTKVDFRKDRTSTIKEAFYMEPSTTDYNGIYKGYYIDFEAKETKNKTSFPLANIHKHQLKHLENIKNHGGIGFIIVRFSVLNKTFLLKAEDLFSFTKDNDRKSIPLTYFESKGYLIKEKYRPRLDYLKVVDDFLEVKNG